MKTQSHHFLSVVILGLLAVSGYMLYTLDRSGRRQTESAAQGMKLAASTIVNEDALYDATVDNETDILSDGRTTVISTATLRRREMLSRRDEANIVQIVNAHGERQNMAREQSRELDDLRRQLANEQFEQVEHSNNHLMKSGQQGGAHVSNTFHTIHQEGARRERAEALNSANTASRVAIQNMQSAESLRELEGRIAESKATIQKANTELDANGDRKAWEMEV